MKNAIVFGATSGIAQSTIHQLAQNGYNLYLLARSPELMNDFAQDCHVRYPQIQVELASYDASKDTGEILTQKIDNAFEKLGKVDLIFIAHGTLPDQTVCAQSWEKAQEAIQINALSIIEICHKTALKLQQQKHGSIAVISSVAGLRGRQSNYIYGTTKGMLNIYLQGLRNSLYPDNIHVLTILPGFVDTKMTTSYKKGLLWAKPDVVAKDIMNAINKKQDILYTPWFWRYIMLILKSIPESLFKKLKT